MMKRILSLLLAMILMAGMIPTQAFAAEEAEAAEEVEEIVEIVEEAEETEAAQETEPAAAETEAVPEETEAAAVETEPVPEETEAAPEETEPAEETEPEESPLAAAIPQWLKDKVSQVSAADIGDTTKNENEYNGTRDDADTIRDDYTMNGSLPEGDVDYFELVIDSDVSEYADLELVMAANAEVTQIVLMDTKGNRWTADNVGYDDGFYWDTLSETLPAGTYYLKVSNPVEVDDSSYTFYVNTIPVPGKPHTVSNVVQGVRIRWTMTSGVSTYGVYRSTDNKKFTRIATVAKTNTLLDTNVVSGTKYYYAIAAYDPDVKQFSSCGAARATIFVNTPDITKRENLSSGVRLTWNQISGATGYAIYRKSYSGTDSWVRMATIRKAKTTTWTDETIAASNGKLYKYTVRALGGKEINILSGCYGNGKTMVRLTTMNLKNAVRVEDAEIKVTWYKNAKADGYQLRVTDVLTGETSYQLLDVDELETVVDDLDHGKEYEFKIRAYKEVEDVGTFYSAWSAGLKKWTLIEQ